MNSNVMFTSKGYEEVRIHRATVRSLVAFLDADKPWVWIIDHSPNPLLEWRETDVPLNTGGRNLQGHVRNLRYDLQLSTPEFLACASAFEQHGIVLIQSTRRMPNTLQLDSVPEDQLPRVLRMNGAFLYVNLPHAVETALVRCFEPGYLARVTVA